MSTNLFDRVGSLLNDKVNGKTPKLKWTAISAHDTFVATLSAALNITSWECILDTYRQDKLADDCEYDFPAFSSNILLELHNNDGQYSVMVKYNGNYKVICEKEEISCEFDEFL